MKDTYTLEKGSFSFYESEDFEDEFFKITDNDNTFHIGQGYEDNTAEKIVCIKCGGSEFNVGKGSYFTAIKCVNCKWERCVHEG